MNERHTLLTSFYAVLNTSIPVVMGVLLAKFRIITPETRGSLLLFNAYVANPVYSLIFIIQAIDENYLMQFGLIIFSGFSCLLIGFVLTVVILIIFDIDIRSRWGIGVSITFGNFVVLPQLLANSLCNPDGTYEHTDSCKNGLVKPYSSVPLVFTNIIYWLGGYYLLRHEGIILLEIKQAYIIILNYYSSIDDFLKDTDLTKYKKPDYEKTYVKTIQEQQENHHDEKPEDEINFQVHVERADVVQARKAVLKEAQGISGYLFQKEYFQAKINRKRYLAVKAHFANFKSKIYNADWNSGNKDIIEKLILEPENLSSKKDIQDDCKIYRQTEKIDLKRIAYIQAFWSTLALVIGFIFPVKEWIFGLNNYPVSIFISTLQTIGSIMPMITLVVLGNFLFQYHKITPRMLLTWKHIVLSSVIRNLILPGLGLIWVPIIIRKMFPDLYNNDPVLMFINYSYWAVPNGLVLIGIYVVSEHYVKEFTILSMYLNLLAAPSITLFVGIFLTIYNYRSPL